MRETMRDLLLVGILVYLIFLTTLINSKCGKDTTVKEPIATAEKTPHINDENLSLIESFQPTSVEYHFDNTGMIKDYTNFNYVAVVNNKEQRFVKTVFLALPNLYGMLSVKVNGMDGQFQEYPPQKSETYNVFAIPAPGRFEDMDMTIEINVSNKKPGLNKIVLYTKAEHWTELERKVAEFTRK